ncbi:class I SAM-dependent methyltransferase [Fredinandcohnia sp. 179-A 10B2 NHS]|uniref:class I SAM-dependent methyltransferase n=1 Tax=Fredinandcohnia sp. 179-A 10B2 NHS TaxID=3235176 RepID=UPI0039A1EF30
MKEIIYNYDDLLEMLDELLQEESSFNWDDFYSVRERKVPFFIDSPDENLVNYFDKNLINKGKVLDLGCGPGRNAIYFADKGCTVDAVDMSQEALDWAIERAKQRNVIVNFITRNIFKLEIAEGTYDVVYDSGCFHHIAPHRRMSYIELVLEALKPGGHFAITCFVEGGEFGGASISDLEVYKLRSLKGGLGFTEEKLRSIFRDFEVIEIRKMKELEPSKGVFGVNGLWTALFKKNE